MRSAGNGTALARLTAMPARAGRTLIAYVLDESGSMEACRDAVLSGFAESLATLRRTPGPDRAALFLVEFNTRAFPVHRGLPLAQVPDPLCCSERRFAQAAQRGPDARRSPKRRARRTPGTSQRARKGDNAADGPLSAACGGGPGCLGGGRGPRDGRAEHGRLCGDCARHRRRLSPDGGEHRHLDGLAGQDVGPLLGGRPVLTPPQCPC